MAEYGAHITNTNNFKFEKPSFFDVVAQETLLGTFEPAFKHVLKVLAEKNPSKYGWCLYYANEIYLSFHTALQYHYLSNYGASFSENFYNLKRVPININYMTAKKNLTNFPQIDTKLIVKSLLTLSLVPYGKQILHQYYENIRDERTEQGSASENTYKEKLKTIFIQLWPLIHMTMQLLTLFYYLRFLIGKSKIHSPLLHFIGVRLATLSEEDQQKIDALSSRLTYHNITSFRKLWRWCFETFGWGLQNFLEVGAFFLQFLDWFYSSSTTRRTLFASNPIPPPPKQDQDIDPRICPICLQEREQETALAVSGYVFCYSCILLYLRQHGKCPVTGYLATTKQLIKIYKE